MLIRSLSPDDYDPVISVIDEWWGGRHMVPMLPRLFFTHFRQTSFAAIDGTQLVGFLVGFLSPAFANEAYIHFVGVHPNHRRRGVAKALYAQFIRIVAEADRTIVRAVTSPTNEQSVAFHRSIGFTCHDGGLTAPAYVNYDDPGEDRILLEMNLENQHVAK